MLWPLIFATFFPGKTATNYGSRLRGDPWRIRRQSFSGANTGALSCAHTGHVWKIRGHSPKIKGHAPKIKGHAFGN